jgi:hypothetical protein
MLLDKIINTVFSVGAAIVIFGAWGKLENKEFGHVALTAGLLTETAIFFLYGILEWRRHPALTNETMDHGEQPRTAEHPSTAQRTDEHPSTPKRTDEHPSTAPWSHGHANIEPRAGSPVHKEDLEALTGSIRETANLLSRIFRV